jgi:hypothetical protein
VERGSLEREGRELEEGEGRGDLEKEFLILSNSEEKLEGDFMGFYF